jgi:hypothetical protein
VGPAQLPNPWQDSWVHANHVADFAPGGWLSIKPLPTPGQGPSESPSINYGTIEFPYECQGLFFCIQGNCRCARGL